MARRTLNSPMQMVSSLIYVCVITACDNAPGPPKLEGGVANSIAEEIRTQRVASSAPQNADQPTLRADERIRIDSVPRGADVSYLPQGSNSDSSSILIGKTPLELDPRRYPSGTFVIMMRIDTYLAAINGIPALADWSKRFSSINDIFGYGSDQTTELFQFDTSTTRRAVDTNRKLIAVGPVYTLDDTTSDRINALFIPREADVSDFFPLMPPDGTYDLDKESYGSSLIMDYGFSLRQATEAVESLARCGKYVTTVDVFRPTGRRSMVVLSAQRGKFLTTAYALQ